MFDRRITTSDASPLSVNDMLNSVHSALAALQDFAAARHGHAALQHGIPAFGPPSLAARYAVANSITRRRFDAMLREAETVARAGARLVAGRKGQHDVATIAAARFLGNSVAGSLRRLENLLAPQAA